MHLITFTEANQVRIGILDQKQHAVIDLRVAASNLPTNMLDFIAQDVAALVQAQAAFNSGKGFPPPVSLNA